MDDRPIGFFDSGVGGLSVLRYAIQEMPEENYVYFGDSLNAPYGIKDKFQVKNLTEDGVKRLIDRGAKAVVIACNTATSIAVEYLREKYDIPLISMEPAIKPALEKTSGKVLLLATSVTVSSERVNNLILRYDVDNRVIKVPCVELAKRIEDAVFGDDRIDEYLLSVLSEYKNKNVTAVVLGCTHYSFVKDRIIGALGHNVEAFDGVCGTVAHLKNVLESLNIKNNKKEKGSMEIESSLNDEKACLLYNKLLYGGNL